MATRKFEVDTHVQLPSNVARALYTLAIVHKTTVADLVEKGIALVMTALKAQQQGYELAVVDKNGEIVADLIGLPTIEPINTEPATIPHHLRRYTPDALSNEVLGSEAVSEEDATETPEEPKARSAGRYRG